jgi:excinuclease ABC subunit C
MREVIYRRFKRYAEQKEDNNEKKNEDKKTDESFSAVPDLVIIDGGKGQLSSAVKVLEDLGIKNLNIIGLAKRLEEVFLPEQSDAQSIPKTSSGLKLLQRVRDEAHRFAVTFHKSLRDKRTFSTELTLIPGIGEKVAKKLLSQFGSVEMIKEKINSDLETFEKIIGKKLTASIKNYFFPVT